MIYMTSMTPPDSSIPIEPQPAPRIDPLAVPNSGYAANGRKLPSPKQKRPSGYRVPPRKDRNGLLIVHTGDGKGKTTAALGIMLRAHGRGMSTAMYQFVKRLDNTGEYRTARILGIPMTPLGAGCVVAKSDIDENKRYAQDGWKAVENVLAAGTYDVLVLDELTLPLR